MVQLIKIQTIAAALDKILITLWVGGLWVTGYFYAPGLFSALSDRALAGSIAGMLFETIAWIGLCTIPVLLLLDKIRFEKIRRLRSSILLVILLMLIISQFYLTPEIRDLRESGNVETREFALFHALSGIQYLLISISGLYLVLCESQKPD